jgi:hypothetical protein
MILGTVFSLSGGRASAGDFDIRIAKLRGEMLGCMAELRQEVGGSCVEAAAASLEQMQVFLFVKNLYIIHHNLYITHHDLKIALLIAAARIRRLVNQSAITINFLPLAILGYNRLTLLANPHLAAL